MKRWTNKSGRLVSFFRGPDRNLVREPVPKYVACEDLLYTAFVSKGNHLYGEESVFKKVDQLGTEALEVALGEKWRDMPDEIAENLYRFMYLLAARHPVVRDEFLNTEGKVFGLIRRDLEDQGLDDYASRFFEDLPKTYTTPRDRATLLVNMLGAFDRFTYKKLFYGAPRIFIDTCDCGHLLTSDHPFVSAPSIGDDGAVHYLPFSPNRGILLSRDKTKIEFLKRLGFERFVSYVNLLTVMFAHEYVYSHSRQDEAIILEHLGGAYRYTRDQFTQVLMEAWRGKIMLGLSKNPLS